MSGNTMLMRSMESSKVAPKHKPTKSNWVLRIFKSENELSRHMLHICVYAYVNVCVCVCERAHARVSVCVLIIRVHIHAPVQVQTHMYTHMFMHACSHRLYIYTHMYTSGYRILPCLRWLERRRRFQRLPFRSFRRYCAAIFLALVCVPVCVWPGHLLDASSTLMGYLDTPRALSIYLCICMNVYA
jgi:hypothetical protein